MTQVAKVEQTAVVEARPSLLDRVLLAASDPATDVDKLERLMGLYERMSARQAEAAFHEAMAEMQPRLPVIDRKGSADKGKWMYARWEDIAEAVQPIIAEHGFSLRFRERWESERIIVTAVLSKGGHTETVDSPPLMADGSGSKNAIQAIASSVSYGKRIAATLALNIITRGEDDDGGSGGGRGISADQFLELRRLMDESHADEAKFLAYLGVTLLDDLPAAKFNAARSALQQKIKAKPNA
jgi:hypothetical protein